MPVRRFSGAITAAPSIRHMAAGGLVGLASQRGSGLYASYNTGEVTGKTYAGGLGGSVLGSNTACNWCYSSGPVNLRDSGYAAVGALFGNLASGQRRRAVCTEAQRLPGPGIWWGISMDFTATGKFISEDRAGGRRYSECAERRRRLVHSRLSGLPERLSDS